MKMHEKFTAIMIFFDFDIKRFDFYNRQIIKWRITTVSSY